MEGIELLELNNMEEVQRALSAPFRRDQVEKNADGREYIPVEFIRERLISVLRVDGFDVTYGEVIHHEEDWITVNCTLTLDCTRFGGRESTTTQPAGVRIKRFKATHSTRPGQIMNLGNDYKAVKSLALTKAAADFGVGLYLALKKGNNNGSSNYGNNNKNYSNQGKNNNHRNQSSNNQNQSKQNQKGKNNQQSSPQNDKELKKYLYYLEAYEKELELTDATKLKIFNTVNPKAPIQKATDIYLKADTNCVKRYTETLKYPAVIKKEVLNSGIEPKLILDYLSRAYATELKSFKSLITLADVKALNAVREQLKNPTALTA